MNEPTETVSSQPTDGKLLAAFLQRRDEVAFAQIVHRHGDMVWAVCMSVLGNGTDAQDAAQAVFLALVQRASSLQGRATLASWLHRVAWYVATRAAASAAVRRHHEREEARMNHNLQTVDPGAGTGGKGDLPADHLHESLSRLPEKYRLPLILHHLEGRSEEEVALLLGQKAGTVSARLTRGRTMLRQRMLKSGLAVSAAALTTTLSAQASTSVPASVAATMTSTAAAVLAGKAAAVGVVSAQTLALSRGALHMLYVAKMKLAALYMTAALVLGGGAIGGYVAAVAALAPVSGAPVAGKQETSPDTQPADSLAKLTDPRQVFRALVVGLQANTRKLASGQGKMTVESTGDYFNAKDKPKHMVSSFMFAGNNLRYDREFSTGLHSPTTIRNDKFELRLEYLGSEQPYVYMQPRPTNDDLFVCNVIDLKGLMDFWQMGSDHILMTIDAGLVNPRVSKQNDGTYSVDLSMPKDPDEVFRLVFDPVRGFGLVREDLMEHGMLLNRIERSYREVDGVWVLDKLTWKRFKLKSDEIDGIEQITLENLLPNIKIADEMFDLRGFNLPPHTSVVDEMAGTRSRLDALLANEKTAKNLMTHGDSPATPAVESLIVDTEGFPSEGIPDSRSMFLDLDNGRHPQFKTIPDQEMIRAAGVDLFYERKAGGAAPRLAIAGLYFQPLAGATGWDSDLETVRRALDSGSPYALLPSEKAPVAFRTREGGIGILQILAVMDKPAIIAIRYKLLGPASATQPAAK